MTILQKLHARAVIHRVDKQQGISVKQCRADMIEAIRAAWTTADPKAKDRQIQLVGEGRIPTPEELIFLISKEYT